MKSSLVAAVALVFSASGMAASPMEAPPSGGISKENLSCTSEVKSHRFVRGTREYDSAMAFHDENSDFPAGAPKVRLHRGAATVYMTVEEPIACSGTGKMAAKWECETTGCTETIIGTETMSPGSKVTLETCGGGFKTTITWTKNGDGTWTVTRVNSEQTTSCNAVG